MDDTNHTFFVVGSGMGFISSTKEVSLDNLVKEKQWSVYKWSYIAHYIRVHFVTKKIEFDRLWGWMTCGSLN